MKQNQNTYTVFLNIYKEAGFTSHDVVAKLRGILHQKKIGHMGTLDPDATGVLPVALGQATRALSLIEDHSKAYDAVLRLGITTDTYDTSGTVCAVQAVTVAEERVRRVMAEFTGELMQVPPMYSAKRQNGKRLYELAREGITVEREAVPIVIDALTITEILLPDVHFSVECSSGTYIRSLCHDIGQALGCGGCMAKLVRTRAGAFAIDDAVTLAQVEELRDADRLAAHIVPIDAVFADAPRVCCKEAAKKRAANGNPLGIDEIEPLSPDNGAPLDRKISVSVRVYLDENKFLGIYYCRGKMLYPRKVFYE